MNTWMEISERSFNVAFDRGERAHLHLGMQVTYAEAQAYASRFEAEYVGKPRPDGKGVYPFTNPRVVFVVESEPDAASCISQQDAELERMRREVEEFNALFEQRWNTDLRAKKRWQDANSDKPNIWPSRDDLLVWLMDQHAEARKAAFIEAAEIATATATDVRNGDGARFTASHIAMALKKKAEETGR